jgi:hypothetical protein
MTDSFKVGPHSKVVAGALKRGVRGAARVRGFSVGIFPLSSHLVITIIMVWTALTALRGAVRRPR